MARTSAWAILVMVMALAQDVMAINHVVGGDAGWHVNHAQSSRTFYQEWAYTNGPYHFGDTLGRYRRSSTLISSEIRILLAFRSALSILIDLWFCAEFNYTPGDEILRVEEDGFNSCDSSSSLWSVSEGHSVFVLAPPLIHVERVYFISGHQSSCALGMRFWIDVVV